MRVFLLAIIMCVAFVGECFAKSPFVSGLEAMNAGRKAEAETFLVEAADDNSYANYLLGLLYEDTRRYPEATARYRSYLSSIDKSNDMFVSAKVHMAFCLAMTGDAEEAGTILDAEVNTAVSRVTIRQIAGQARLEIAAKSKSEKDAGKAYQDFLFVLLKKKSVEGVNGLGRARLLQYDLGGQKNKACLADALAAFCYATGKKPGNAVYQNNLGVALYRAEDIDDALAKFNLSKQLDSSYLNAKKNIAHLEAMVAKNPNLKKKHVDCGAYKLPPGIEF